MGHFRIYFEFILFFGNEVSQHSDGLFSDVHLRGKQCYAENEISENSK